MANPYLPPRSSASAPSHRYASLAHVLLVATLGCIAGTYAPYLPEAFEQSGTRMSVSAFLNDRMLFGLSSVWNSLWFNIVPLVSSFVAGLTIGWLYRNPTYAKGIAFAVGIVLFPHVLLLRSGGHPYLNGLAPHWLVALDMVLWDLMAFPIVILGLNCATYARAGASRQKKVFPIYAWVIAGTLLASTTSVYAPTFLFPATLFVILLWMASTVKKDQTIAA